MYKYIRSYSIPIFLYTVLSTYYTTRSLRIYLSRVFILYTLDIYTPNVNAWYFPNIYGIAPELKDLRPSDSFIRLFYIYLLGLFYKLSSLLNCAYIY